MITRTKTSKVAVAWCRECCMYSTLPDDIGHSCWSNDCPRILIKRVGYICPSCLEIHWNVKSLKECDHDAY